MKLEEVPACKEGLNERGSSMVGHLTRPDRVSDQLYRTVARHSGSADEES